MKVVVAFACLLAVSASTAVAQSKNASLADDTFVRAALTAGTQEIREGGQDADSSNAAIAAFAMRMVKDHSEANTQLLALAHQLDITVPNDELPPSGAQEQPKGIQSPPVSATSHLDPKAYFRKQVAAHRKAIALFEGEISRGSKAQIKAFARQTLPTLQAHLALAQKDLENAAH